jgi:hypothetical protein
VLVQSEDEQEVGDARLTPPPLLSRRLDCARGRSSGDRPARFSCGVRSSRLRPRALEQAPRGERIHSVQPLGLPMERRVFRAIVASTSSVSFTHPRT